MSGLIKYLDVEDATRNALNDLAACRQEYERLPADIVDVSDQIRLVDLEEYLLYFAVCWDHMEQWERDSLYCRFVSGRLSIKAFMAQYHICRSDAYRKSDAALKRLAKLLYW